MLDVKHEFYKCFERLKLLACDRFNCKATGEEAFNDAFEEVSKHDWRRLKAHRGKEKQFCSFLRVTFGRLLTDYAIRKGIEKKLYIPKWVREKGFPFPDVYELLFWKQGDIDYIVQCICRQSRDRNCREKVENAVGVILSRALHLGSPSPMDNRYSFDDEKDNGKIKSGRTPEDVLIEAQTRTQFTAFVEMLLSSSKAEPSDPEISDKWIRFKAQLNLTFEEQIFLKTYYQRAQKHNPKPDPVPDRKFYTKKYRIFKKIKQAFKTAGFELDDYLSVTNKNKSKRKKKGRRKK